MNIFLTILILVLFFIYSSFCSILTLKIGNLTVNEKEKPSFIFLFIYLYGKIFIIIFPILCIVYFIINILSFIIQLIKIQ